MSQKVLPAPSAIVSAEPSQTASLALNETKSPESSKQPAEIPAQLNLDVPFTSQAPTANWDKTHEEACEEAAILMAGRYFQDKKISGTDDAETGLNQIIEWEMQNLGFFESTTVVETEKVIKGTYGLNTQVIENPTVEQIKSAISQGKLVLSPSAGRQLHNPFYKSPGPLYHMLLIKGYTKDKFITNDTGTKRGENYPYDFQTILDANHDWNGGAVETGSRKMILVWRI